MFLNHIKQTCRSFQSCLECMLTVEDDNVTVSNVGCNDTCPVIVLAQDAMIEGAVNTLCILCTPQYCLGAPTYIDTKQARTV